MQNVYCLTLLKLYTMSELENRLNLEKVSKEIYPSIRRDAKMSVNMLDVAFRYLRMLNYHRSKGSLIYRIVLKDSVDISKYERRLQKYKKELSFRNPNIIVAVLFTQMVVENCQNDLDEIRSHINQMLTGDTLTKYIGRESLFISDRSSFEVFKRAAIPNLNKSTKTRERSVKDVISEMDSYMFIDDIKSYFESTEISKYDYDKYGRVYAKKYNYVCMNETKYSVNMDVNIRSKYINSIQGLEISSRLVNLLKPLVDNPIIHPEINGVISKLNRIISEGFYTNYDEVTISISSLMMDDPAELINVVQSFKNVMKSLSTSSSTSKVNSNNINKLIEEVEK